MANSFVIPKRAYEGFVGLITLGSEKLGRLADEVSNCEITINIFQLAHKLENAIEFDREQIELIIQYVLLPLNRLRAEFQLNPDEFLDLLNKTISTQNEKWLKEHEGKWNEIANEFKRLLVADGFFAQIEKTYQVVIDRPIIGQSFRITTELRPVFDDAVSTTKAFVLTSTLVVEYSDGEISKKLHVSLDQADLRSLQEQLDRAENQIQLMDGLAERLGVPVLFAGSEQE